LSRDRSRPERTSEERERDRLERERRRAERAGASPPEPSEPFADEAVPVEFATVDPDGLEPPPAHEPHLTEEETFAQDAAFAQQPSPEYEQPLEQELPAAEAALVPDAIPASDEHLAPVEDELAGSDEPAPAGEHPVPVEDELAAAVEEGPAPLEDGGLPEPVIVERRGERTRPRRHPRAEDPEATQGYEIPGLPTDGPEPPPRQGLPEPPPRVGAGGAAPARRAFDRDASRLGAAGPVGPPRERARRGVGSRLAALVALAAVAVAVVLLVHSLKGSSKTKGPLAAPVVKVLIAEGKTRLQIAQIAKAAGLKGSYRTAARRSALLNPSNYGAPKSTPDLEGFLFPATYEMDKGASAARLVEEQLTAFQEHFGEEETKRAKDLGVTPYELLTVASMVEREAQVPGDRAKIAAVIYNRLKAGMPLGIDATIYYAVETEKNIPTYTKELTESQLRIDSPYNTRTHTGLPPTPISNPGVASIQAAAHPSHASYLYYVAGADGCGEQVFSSSQSDFEANVAAYEEAKRKNGGKPPVCKKKH